jgi:hypothetical protein
MTVVAQLAAPLLGALLGAGGALALRAVLDRRRAHRPRAEDRALLDGATLQQIDELAARWAQQHDLPGSEIVIANKLRLLAEMRAPRRAGR